MSKADANKKTWEDSDVPALCESCLGPNPYVRMTREKYGLECKLCTRPFTVFRWSPEKGSKPRKTIICQTCARQKNACQSCMLDLTYGLPLAIRDAALNMANSGQMITSDAATNVIMKQYVAQKFEASQKSFAEEDEEREQNQLESGVEPGQLVISEQAKNLLRNLAKAMPHYRGPVGTDAAGTATGGAGSSRSGSSTSSNGRGNDGNSQPEISPAVKAKVSKIISKLPLNGSISPPPKDAAITSLFLMGVEDDLPEYKIRNHFQAYGPIKTLVLVHRARCAFITYEKRAHAETAAASLASSAGRLVINGCKLKAVWGRPHTLGSTYQENYLVGLAVKKSLRSSSAARSSTSTSKPQTKLASSKSQPNRQTTSNSPLAPPTGASVITYDSQRPDYEH
ncbi:Ecm2p [Sugiyamaella lignohabitans]|uniref:Pre-mRNA-splicing factor SLT11 n=1 Tax=Sugiyamaella lignohabitans TaxID=796027 RepID=A0A167EHZ3_9ASCO|nr:Ecm2p [Sugiyamaella lignohabitans]ANB14106.1 Ecm2p [Sugiyamaella lignohabitans]